MFPIPLQPILLAGSNASNATIQPSTDGDDGHCIWYGICGVNRNGKKQYCSYNGPAKLLDTAGQDLMRVWCPHVLERYKNYACCDNAMVSMNFRYKYSICSSCHLPKTFNTRCLFKAAPFGRPKPESQ